MTKRKEPPAIANEGAVSLPVVRRLALRPPEDTKCTGLASNRGDAITVTGLRPDRVLNVVVEVIDNLRTWVVSYFELPPPVDPPRIKR